MHKIQMNFQLNFLFYYNQWFAKINGERKKKAAFNCRLRMNFQTETSNSWLQPCCYLQLSITGVIDHCKSPPKAEPCAQRDHCLLQQLRVSIVRSFLRSEDLKFNWIHKKKKLRKKKLIKMKKDKNQPPQKSDNEKYQDLIETLVTVTAEPEKFLE